MELSYAFFLTITTVLGILVALFVFRAVVVPTAIYFYNYFYYGQEKAEKEALDSMGENHASYALRDTLKQDSGVNVPALKEVQDGVADTAGNLVGKGGAAESVGQVSSDVGNGVLGGLGQK